MGFLERHLLSKIAHSLPAAIFYKHTTSKVISLTIDDVGDADTLKILTVIDEFNDHEVDELQRVTATFFVITDYLQKSSEILDKIRSCRHEIGNHGQRDHRHASLSRAEFEREIRQAHQMLSHNTAGTVKWFRPGQAFYNQDMIDILQMMPGYYDKFALASMVPVDTFWPTNDPGFTLNYLSRFIFPGSILLLHGGTPSRTANTVKVLKPLLAKLRQQEYRVLTLTELWTLEN